LTDKSSPGDWRLPTIDEWQATIAHAVALGCKIPDTEPSLTNDAGTGCLSVGPSSFTGGFTTPFYWSSSTDETNPSSAWAVNIFSGIVFTPTGSVSTTGKSIAFRVWPVRDGSS
jgi:Protein of unknown function (DUF1566)